MKGNVTNTGYWPNSPDRNNDFNIIPSSNITTKGMDIPLIGISDTGDIKKMVPGKDYKFDGNYVTEFPMNNNAIFLGKYKFANGGLVRLDEGGETDPPKKSNPKDELARFSKQPINTNDPRYLGSQQSVADKTVVATPKPKGNPVEEDAARVHSKMVGIKKTPKGFVARQAPGALGSMQTVYENPQTGEMIYPEAEVQQAIMNRKDDADMLLNRLNPLTAPGAMAFYGASNIAAGNLVEGALEMALGSPLVGNLIHGATHMGVNKGVVSQTLAPVLNKRLHQAYEIKHNAATAKTAGKDQSPSIEQIKKYVYKPEFIDSNVDQKNYNLPFWMQEQADSTMMYGGDISVPDLRRVVIKKVPSWKKS